MATIFRKEYHIGIPANIEDTIIRLGGSIRYEFLPNENSKLKKLNNKEFLIFVNFKATPGNIKFYIAREIAHLIFDGGFLINNLKWESIENNSYIENTSDVELINEFAAALIMPLNRFKSDLRDNCGPNYSPDINKMASLYGVTYDLIISRGMRLGLLSF